MPKIKLPRSSPHIDMTPMVDLFSLLLTFFMLTTSFRPQEAAVIDTPSSISEKQAPDKNTMTILLSKDNMVYFNVDNKFFSAGGTLDSTRNVRADVLKQMGDYYKVKFTAQQLKKFEGMSSFGCPIAALPKYIDAKDQKERDALMEVLKKEKKDGIPIDSADNQLASWILYARTANPNLGAIIKADLETDYAVVKKVLDILQEKQVNKFNLITNLEKEEVNAKEIK